MSGIMARRPAGTNVVPMPAAAPPGQMMPMTGTWPMPPFPAGCCPPGGMDALMQCYCDIQAATAFISKVVQDLAANDPAFQQSLVDAIVASGSNVPLVGVTNGADAQPGQVGEWAETMVGITYPTGSSTQSVTMGILQPGDWDVWAFFNPDQAISAVQFYLNPLPAGMMGGNLPGWFIAATDVNNALIISPVNRALISVPTLFVFTLITQTTGAGGPGQMVFLARRRR